MSATFDYTFAAQVLVDREAIGNAAAARRYDITSRTVQNYAARLRTDPELQEAVQTTIEALSRSWQPAAHRALGQIMRTLDKSAEAARDNPALLGDAVFIKSLVESGYLVSQITRNAKYLELKILEYQDQAKNPDVPGHIPDKQLPAHVEGEVVKDEE